jgi:uncharacterized membrane protein YphA (DoxX/SURF4 family)
MAMRPFRRGFNRQLPLWEYVGYPDDETPERRRLLYAIVVLRLGLGLLLLLRGGSAVFLPAPDGFTMRLGDPARWGFSPATSDLALFLLGCTEIAAGALLLCGAFTRVSAVTGTVLCCLYLALGRGLTGAALIGLCAAIGGLLIPVICGSPFLGADRALDKLEEEERDRAPAVLPRRADVTPLFARLGLAAGLAGWGWGYQTRWFGVLGLVLALALVLGWRTRVVALVALLAGTAIALGWHGEETGVWFFLAPLAVGGALLVAGGGQWSLDCGARPPQPSNARGSR